MASIKHIAANCIGISTPFSIVIDFFGYVHRGHKKISLLQQARLLKGGLLQINIIRVGTLRSDNYWEDVDEKEIDEAVQILRDVYSAISLGIRVSHFGIPLSQSGGYENIHNKEDAIELTSKWNVDNDGIDVFIVPFYSGGACGQSPVSGTSDKEDKESMDGCVVELRGCSSTGRTLAHEICHYLGLEHPNPIDWSYKKYEPCYNCPVPHGVYVPPPVQQEIIDSETGNVIGYVEVPSEPIDVYNCLDRGIGVCQNLMTQSKWAGTPGTTLTLEQGNIMKSHPFCKGGCQ
jgi:hypothetical protein